MDKNILIIGFNSELAQNTIKELKQNNWNIYATSRQVGMMEDKVHEYNLDVTNEMNFIHLKEKFSDLKFDVILNFAGIAIAGAVEQLDELELKKQFDVNFLGLLRIIKYFAPNLNKGGRLINISSMASYGIFPFLTPYCASKASADILLNNYSIENNVKVVSIRPGAVATKFWESSIELNKNTLIVTLDGNKYVFEQKPFKVISYWCLENGSSIQGRIDAFRYALNVRQSLMSKTGRKLLYTELSPELLSYIQNKLDDKYSPDAISGELKQAGINTVCTQTIYNYISLGILKSAVYKRHTKKAANKARIAYNNTRGRSIEERPFALRERIYGNWEMDTVVGKQGSKAALLVLTERVSRFEIIIKLRDKTQKSIIAALDKQEKAYKDKFSLIFKSITVDNGKRIFRYGKFRKISV